jgi:hypothetical protein
MEPHQERVRTELAELEEKIDKLTAFIKTDFYNQNLSNYEKDMLVRQRAAMRKYAEILTERISFFNEET